MKPVESNISPYLQQPLRTLDEVRQERERRQRELAEAQAKQAKKTQTQRAPAVQGDTAPAASPVAAAGIDQTV